MVDFKLRACSAIIGTVILISPLSTAYTIPASAAYSTTNGTIVVTQSEYDELIKAWNGKKVPYLGIQYNPSSGEAKMVGLVQKYLNLYGDYKLTIDKKYGPATSAAVKKFQLENGLVADSCFGDESFSCLLSKIVIEDVQTSIGYSSMTVPKSVQQGSSFNLGGTIITTNSKIKTVKGEILDANGNTVLKKTDKVNTYKYDIRSNPVNTELKFGTLSAGAYTLRFKTTTADGTVKTYTSAFEVKGSPPVSAAMQKVYNDLNNRFNGRSVFKSEWCATYCSRYIRLHLGETNVSESYNVGGLTANIINANEGTLYLFSQAHYNAVKAEANGEKNVYKWAQFKKQGLKNTKLVSKSDIVPQQGDLIIFRWNGTPQNEMSHIGIVDSFNGENTLTTIEGNTTYNSTKNRDFLNRGTRNYNSANIIGIIRLK